MAAIPIPTTDVSPPDALCDNSLLTNVAFLADLYWQSNDIFQKSLHFALFVENFCPQTDRAALNLLNRIITH